MVYLLRSRNHAWLFLVFGQTRRAVQGSCYTSQVFTLDVVCPDKFPSLIFFCPFQALISHVCSIGASDVILLLCSLKMVGLVHQLYRELQLHSNRMHCCSTARELYIITIVPEENLGPCIKETPWFY
jgi:hypothetical protein